MKKILSTLIIAVPALVVAQDLPAVTPEFSPKQAQQAITEVALQDSPQSTPSPSASEVPSESPEEATATILFKSRGDAMHVSYHTSTHETPCEDLTHTATVYDAELLRAKLLPFIAKMQQKARAATGVYPEAERTVKAGVPLQVLGQSNWYNGANVGSSGSCGPFTQIVTPQAGHKYLVLFEFAADRCGQSIQDITDPAAPVPVELKPLACTKP